MLARSLAALTLPLVATAMITQLYQGFEYDVLDRSYYYYLLDGQCEHDIPTPLSGGCYPMSLNVKVHGLAKIDFSFSKYYFDNIKIKRQPIEGECQGEYGVFIQAACYTTDDTVAVRRRVPPARPPRRHADAIAINRQ